MPGDQGAPAQPLYRWQKRLDLRVCVDDFYDDREVIRKPPPRLVDMTLPAKSGDAARDLGAGKMGFPRRLDNRFVKWPTLIHVVVADQDLQ